MKTTNILPHIPADLRESTERHANKFAATQTIIGEIGLISESELLRFTDDRVFRWRYTRLGISVEELSREQRLQNLAERLVVAARIQSAKRADAVNGATATRRRATSASLAAA